MAITCNFDREDFENRREDREDKLIVRIAPGQLVGVEAADTVPEDTPAQRPVKHGAYLWVLGNRRRSGKSWRDPVSVN